MSETDGIEVVIRAKDSTAKPLRKVALGVWRLRLGWRRFFKVNWWRLKLGFKRCSGWTIKEEG